MKRSAIESSRSSLISLGSFALLLSLLCPLMSYPSESADHRSPEYVLGYATAVLERTEPQQDFTIDFVDHVVHVDFASTPDVPFDTILRALLTVDGVEGAEISVAGSLAARSSPSGSPPPTASQAKPVEIDAEGDDSSAAPTDVAVVSVETIDPSDVYDIFSLGELFEPLIADPRWPRFSASHLWYLGDDELERVGSATFGESFSFVRSPRRSWGQWELGFQAGVFSVFDLEASSSDLVNSDFLVGLTFSHHYGDFTSILRVYHQSSHLGDEYLLRNRVDRVNLSFEVLDLLVSYEPWQWLRLYGGGGILMHREPALDRGIFQAGVELESPRAFAGGYFRPVAGTDFQLREESDWRADISALAGLQIEHPFLRRTRLRILAEFYSGRSPNGQFYDRRIETIGLGIHLGI